MKPSTNPKVKEGRNLSLLATMNSPGFVPHLYPCSPLNIGSTSGLWRPGSSVRTRAWNQLEMGDPLEMGDQLEMGFSWRRGSLVKGAQIAMGVEVRGMYVF